jgi:2-desacetyl-2-hydroxyethyl bacteriochlorophyllide A dehydrogenase
MMKALSLESPQTFRYVEIPDPGKPGADEVLVRIHRIGICGTDFSGYLGKMPFFSYPRIPGHELGVEVLEVGPNVTNVKVGDRCSVEPYINCQKCYSCQRGYMNCCEHHKTLGVMCDGGMTERMLLPARKLHLSHSLTYTQLALVETLAIGCHAVNRAVPKSNETVLVIGAGPIGLSVIEFAKLSGAKTIVMDMNADRLAFVRNQIGVSDTIQVQPGSEDRALVSLAETTNGQLADIVVDATGSNKSMAACMNFAAFKARIVYVGITQQEISFPHAPLFHRRELTLMASRNALPVDFSRIIRLIETGEIDTKPWITHEATFDQMFEVFPNWLNPETGVIKAVVEGP